MSVQISSEWRIAILKPDHLGDLILAVPAIRVLAQQFYHITLFVASSNFTLAQYLFPELTIHTLDAPHLSRAKSIPQQYFTDQLISLNDYDLVVCLRTDEFFSEKNLANFCKNVICSKDLGMVHETIQHKNTLCELVTDYPIYRFFYLENIPKWPNKITHLGLSIGASTFNKQWNIFSWLELIQLLSKHNIKPYLIGGPSEIPLAKWLLKTSGLPTEQCIIGSQDFSTFFKKIEIIDAAVCIDGGTMHLISLYKPVLALFGASPFQKFSPIGPSHRVLTLQLQCSPCPGFHSRAVSGCVTQDCMNGILPQAILEALSYPEIAPGQNKLISLAPHPHLYFGPCFW